MRQNRKTRITTPFMTWFQWTSLAAGCVIMVLVIGCSPDTPKNRAAAKKQLKMIGVALHNYHDVYRSFPPGVIADLSEKEHHGWMYSLGPFLEMDQLLEGIDPNVPWDDPVNRSKYQIAYPAAINPVLGKDKSNIEHAHYSGNSHIFKPNKGTRISDVRDGVANTLGIGEINSNFPIWGEPGNVRDPADGLNLQGNTFGSPFEGGVHFLMLDGSVRFLSDKLDKEVLNAFATPDSGERVITNSAGEIKVERRGQHKIPDMEDTHMTE